MYAYFPQSQKYWYVGESGCCEGLALLPQSEVICNDEHEIKGMLARQCFGVDSVRNMEFSIVAVNADKLFIHVSADITELYEDGLALPKPFEISRNEILLGLAKQYHWSDQELAHAADNLNADAEDEHVLMLSTGREIRIPTSVNCRSAIRITQLNFEIARFELDEFPSKASELLISLFSSLTERS